nr:hypothetical protein [Tanacetum cinerariifolium]
PYPYSWVLTNKTPVSELIEPIPAMLPCCFDSTNFRDLQKYAHTETSQNVRCVMLKCYNSKEQDVELIRKPEEMSSLANEE